LGVSVIVDSPLSYPVGYTTACELAERYGAHLLVVETALAEVLWRARLDARPAEESTHKIRGWPAMQAQLQVYNDCWRYPIQPEHHLIVNTEQPLATMLTLVQQRLTQE
jgi:predicted kinase